MGTFNHITFFLKTKIEIYNLLKKLFVKYHKLAIKKRIMQMTWSTPQRDTGISIYKIVG